MNGAWHRRLGRWLVGLSALAALLAVFMAYQSPHLALDLANRIWSCF